ncbi:MAG: hypothetical protein R2768_06125 [Gordonia sp. (in: high G+C Gram-positive bacteria)]
MALLAGPRTRDNITLNKQIERAQDIAEGRRPPKKDRFVSLGTRRQNWDLPWRRPASTSG